MKTIQSRDDAPLEVMEHRCLDSLLDVLIEDVAALALQRIRTAACGHGHLAAQHDDDTLQRIMAGTLGAACAPLLRSAIAAATSAESAAPRDSLLHWNTERLRDALPQFSIKLDCWLASGEAALLEWQERYLADRPRLTGLADHSELGRLCRLEPLSHESHDGGRRPLLMHFDCGTRIVYKPRGAEAERFFFAVLARLRERVPALMEQHAADLLDCGSHSWMAFVEHRPTRSELLHRDFFQRMGGLLALAHALRVGDLHNENVIAHDGFPVLVDLEVLLQPTLPWSTPRMCARDASVLGTGLLPRRAPGTGADQWNRSGITLSASCLREDTHLGIDSQGRVDLSHSRRSVPAPNSPFIDDPPAEALPDLREALLAGFDQYHAALADAARDPVFRNWIEARCSGIPLRCVLRETSHYAQLHSALHHPAVLCGRSDVEDILNRLALAHDKAPQLAGVFAAERCSLAAADVPSFRTHSDSGDLCWQGETLLPGFVADSGKQRLLASLARLDAHDRDRQRALIRESMGEFAAPRPLDAAPLRETDGPDRVLAVAAGIGEWLLSREHDGFWFQTEFSARSGSVCPAATSDRLSDGRLGIALFFAALHARGAPAFGVHAQRLFDLVEAECRAGRIPNTLGGHEGLGGHIFAFCAAARLLGEPRYIGVATRCLDAVPPRLDADRHLDLYAGSAGTLLACLALAGLADGRALDTAIACRAHLLRHAQRNARGAGWPNPIAPAGRHLLGMAHGSHGIALALGRLQASVPDARTRSLLADVLDYEAASFDACSGRWPDLRKPPELALAADREESWCNGASGIGLACMLLDGLDLGVGDYVSWGRRAIQAVRVNLACRSPCLCHGSLGNAWLLQRFDSRDPDTRETIASLVDGVIDDLHRVGAVCGVQPNRALPGLMTGVAGMGYGLLQLASQDPLPDILTLELAP